LGKAAKKKSGFWRTLKANWAFLLMVLPGTVYVFIFSYLPLPGLVMGFQRLSLASNNIVTNILNSRWVGFANFEFFFKSPDAFKITRNTIIYNVVFIVLGLVAAVSVAIAANELHSKTAVKFYQSVMILPAFLSWVVVSYLLYSFLNPDFGVVNMALKSLNLPRVNWYSEKRAWPFLLPLFNMWKGVGMGSIYYFAALSGIDQEMYQSAQLDGASKWKQIVHITLPCLRPTMIILTILSLGNIIRSDFGIFYVATLELGKGALYDVASTIDTFVYITLKGGRMPLATAIGLFQSVVGFFMIVAANLVVRKVDRDSAMF
jgi:putative aldouronate transport system permease protein